MYVAVDDHIRQEMDSIPNKEIPLFSQNCPYDVLPSLRLSRRKSVRQKSTVSPAFFGVICEERRLGKSQRFCHDAGSCASIIAETPVADRSDQSSA